MVLNLRAISIAIAFLSASHVLCGETTDTRLDEAVKEIALLKRMAADQDRRIASLERAVQSQQRAILAAAQPPPALSWRTPEGWAAVKVGMSRTQVVDILGEPKSTDVVIDRQTLYYKEGATPIGQVVITDDRVSEVASRRFRIYAPAQE